MTLLIIGTVFGWWVLGFLAAYIAHRIENVNYKFYVIMFITLVGGFSLCIVLLLILFTLIPWNKTIWKARKK